jgi:DNA polymerase-3 subunit alpha
MSFVHLHGHSDFSFGDGACRIDELVETAARAGMPALAVTDHDGLYGAVRFYQACKKAGTVEEGRSLDVFHAGGTA